jgi:hypothetical protein
MQDKPFLFKIFRVIIIMYVYYFGLIISDFTYNRYIPTIQEYGCHHTFLKEENYEGISNQLWKFFTEVPGH